MDKGRRGTQLSHTLTLTQPLMRKTSHLGLVFAFFVLSIESNQSHAQAWQPTSIPSAPWHALACSADGNTLATGVYGDNVYGPILCSTNGGVTWFSNNVTDVAIQSIAISADGKRLAAAASDGVYLSTNSGVTWTASSAPAANWASIASSADGLRLVAVGYDSIYTSTNGGADWVASTAPESLVGWEAVASSADGGHLVIAYIPGYIYTSTNFGDTWVQTSAPGQYWQQLACSADGSMMVAGVNDFPGPIYLSTNSGVTWNPVSVPDAYSAGLACSADGKKLFGSTAYELPIYYSSANGGTQWTTNAAPDLSCGRIVCSADGCKLAMIANSTVYIASSVPSPELKIAKASANAVDIAWIIPSTNFLLEVSTNLSSTNWNPVSTPTQIQNFENHVVLSATNAQSFYRLKSF